MDFAPFAKEKRSIEQGTRTSRTSSGTRDWNKGQTDYRDYGVALWPKKFIEAMFRQERHRFGSRRKTGARA